MKNLDVLNQEKIAIMQDLQRAVKDDNPEAFSSAFTKFADNIAQKVTAQFEGYQQTADINVMASRGIRQLTSEENKYFQRLGEALKSGNPKQALADMEEVLPKTEIDAVFDDLKTSHPLLDAITFENTSGLIEMIVNTHEDQLGTWGVLTAEVVKELTSGFKKVQMLLNKYSAFIPVAKSMLDLGPVWLETYVRTILQETIYLGLEEAIIKGTGKNMPIGMIRQVGTGVTVTDGVYPEKETVAVAALDPVTYGTLLAGMAKTPNGHQRAIQNVIMVVSPADYFTKVMPATTIRAADGTYVNNVLPFPTSIVQSIHVPEGKMIIGLAKRYFMGVGLGKSGKIEYSDDYHFLEDERVYLCKLYGHGEPLDNNSFVYCDISGLMPAVQKVEITNASVTGATTPDNSNP